MPQMAPILNQGLELTELKNYREITHMIGKLERYLWS